MVKSVRNQITSLLASTVGPLANMRNNHIKQLNEITPKDVKVLGNQNMGYKPGDKPFLQSDLKADQAQPIQQAQPQLPQSQSVNKFGAIPPMQKTGPSGVGAPRTGLSLGNF